MRFFRVVVLCGLVAALVQETDLAAQTGGRLPFSRPNATSSSRSSKVLTIGRLRRNPSRQKGAPPYILLKRDGSLRCLVTPAPGLDLRAYLDTRIGIRGQARRVTETGVLQVRVDRVSPLAAKAAAGDRVATAGGTRSATARASDAAPVGHDQRAEPARQAAAPMVAESNARRRPGRTADWVSRSRGTATPVRNAAGTSGPYRVEPAAAGGDPPGATAEPLAAPRGALRQMDDATQIPEELTMPELIGPSPVDGAVLGGGPEFGLGPESCPTGQCGGDCRPPCGPHCPCGSPWKYWVRAEYLLWWTDGMKVPPLATTSPAGTPVGNAGVLGMPGTTILFGGTDVMEDSQSGGRILLGMWLGGCDSLGIEAEYFGLDRNSLAFSADSDAQGSPILARPFFNVNPRDDGTGDFDPPARRDSELVAYPDILAGGVRVDVSSQLNSASARFLVNLICRTADGQDPCGQGCGIPRRERLDMLLGYRYVNLDERVAIREDLTSLDSAAPGRFQILDQFDTENQFNGLELGVRWKQQRPRWFVEMLGKLALGNSHQVVHINGATRAEPTGGAASTARGGLLAQRSNIGNYARDDFAVVPEFGATLGYRLTQRLHATFGYTFVYWSRVVRPGDVIDLDVNPDLLPPETDPLVGLMRPAFSFVNTDYWAQGLNFGLDYRW